MRTINRTIVAALIFSADGKILQGKKDPSKGSAYNQDFWHMPGGGVEESETLESALVREVKEETGIDIGGLPCELIDNIDSGQSEKVMPDGEKVLAKMKFYNYKVSLLSNANQIFPHSLDGEFMEFRWSEPRELRNLKLTPPSLNLFKKLGFI